MQSSAKPTVLRSPQYEEADSLCGVSRSYQPKNARFLRFKFQTYKLSFEYLDAEFEEKTLRITDKLRCSHAHV